MTIASVRRFTRLLRFLATASMLLAFAALPSCGTHLTPPLAHVAGRAVEVVEAGAGKATVVFESGWGDGWTPWDTVATEVAVEARVFAYSRPGYGDSDSSPDPRDPTRIAEDLRALLVIRGFAPPYVLVGHSFGGPYMELFAKAHPEEIAGGEPGDPEPRCSAQEVKRRTDGRAGRERVYGGAQRFQGWRLLRRAARLGPHKLFKLRVL